MCNEEWRPVRGYEGSYEVSNIGRVRSMPRTAKNGWHYQGKVLKQSSIRGGYLRTFLYDGTGRKQFLVHRLVAQAFLNNQGNLPKVNHIDENVKNNVASNLEWCTERYNHDYGTRTERAARAQHKPLYVVTATGHRYWFESTIAAAKLLGLRRTMVSDCLHGRKKHHKDYTFQRPAVTYDA